MLPTAMAAFCPGRRRGRREPDRTDLRAGAAHADTVPHYSAYVTNNRTGTVSSGQHGQ